jgi:glycosyltransferase involved in cell wall biosynthesis
MCTFNGARFLCEQLESIGAQSLTPDELVVCDDGSTDKTTELIRSFAKSAKFPVRLVVNQQNLGPAKNFEKALTLCRGDLIALSDQDDYWYVEKLSRLSRVMEGDETLGGVFSDGDVIDENSRRCHSHLWSGVGYRPPNHSNHVEESLASRLLRGDVVTGATLMIRAKMRDLLFPVPEGWMHDAWIAWMLVLYSGIAVVDEPLIAYRIHEMQHAGISPRSLTARINSARRTGRTQCVPAWHRFEQLRSHWTANPGNDFEMHLNQIEEKIGHLRYRLDLPSNFLKRLYRVIYAYNRYRRYANGPATMWRDLMVY